MTAPESPATARASTIDWSGCRTVRDVIRAATTFLDTAGIEDSAVDARRLVVHAFGIDREILLREPEAQPDACALTALASALVRRAAHEPVARIVGTRDFYGLTLALNPDTLDPRPDTETIVAAALHFAALIPRGGDEPLRILDLGTGTGAIALALLSALPDAETVATDISPSALAIAAENAMRHGLAARATFVQSHWLDAVDGRFHLIVSNPPYIPSAEIPGLEPEVTGWDPPRALDGGPDGLEAYRAILADAARVLAPGGWIVFEVGHDQSRLVAGLATEHGYIAAPLDLPLLRDLGGIARCVAVATPRCDNKKKLGIEDRSV